MSPVERHAQLVFRLRPGAYTDQTLIEFLTDPRELEPCPVMLIWEPQHPFVGPICPVRPPR